MTQACLTDLTDIWRSATMEGREVLIGSNGRNGHATAGTSGAPGGDVVSKCSRFGARNRKPINRWTSMSWTMVFYYHYVPCKSHIHPWNVFVDFIWFYPFIVFLIASDSFSPPIESKRKSCQTVAGVVPQRVASSRHFLHSCGRTLLQSSWKTTERMSCTVHSHVQSFCGKLQPFCICFSSFRHFQLISHELIDTRNLNRLQVAPFSVRVEEPLAKEEGVVSAVLSVAPWQCCASTQRSSRTLGLEWLENTRTKIATLLVLW